jgi:hypothetical protein
VFDGDQAKPAGLQIFCWARVGAQLRLIQEDWPFEKYQAKSIASARIFGDLISINSNGQDRRHNITHPNGGGRCERAILSG